MARIWAVKARKSAAKPEAWLGASQPVGTLIIVLFVPSQDRDGNDINHDFWVTGALETLAKLFQGTTPLTRGLVACGATMSGADCCGMSNRR